jgi:hypothetical protein
MRTAVGDEVVAKPTSLCELLHSEKLSDEASLLPLGAGASGCILGFRQTFLCHRVTTARGRLMVAAAALEQEITSKVPPWCRVLSRQQAWGGGACIRACGAAEQDRSVVCLLSAGNQPCGWGQSTARHGDHSRPMERRPGGAQARRFRFAGI